MGQPELLVLIRIPNTSKSYNILLIAKTKVETKYYIVIQFCSRYDFHKFNFWITIPNILKLISKFILNFGFDWKNYKLLVF